jgi:hypothetical protein
MPELPKLNCSLLVRTDFTSDDAWRQVRNQALRDSEEGFRAYLEPVSDPAFDGARWEKVKAAVPLTKMARRCASDRPAAM